MSRDILIVALTGMPGAGKTTVANYLHHMGIPLLIMGDVIREAAESQGLAPTSDNLANLMIKLRKKNGPGAVAHLITNKIKLMRKEDNKLNVVIVDGIRSMAEVEVLKDIGNVKLLAIHGSTFTSTLMLRKDIVLTFLLTLMNLTNGIRLRWKWE